MLAVSPIAALAGLLLGFVLSAVLIAVLRDRLPQDHGRAFAVNGQVSKGKARGSGVIFIPVFAAVTMLVTPFSYERCAYLFLTMAGPSRSTARSPRARLAAAAWYSSLCSRR